MFDERVQRRKETQRTLVSFGRELTLLLYDMLWLHVPLTSPSSVDPFFTLPPRALYVPENIPYAPR